MTDEVTPPVPQPQPVPAPQPRPEPEPEMFSKDYVRELRGENKTWRHKASEAERIANEAKAAADTAKAEAEAAKAAAQAEAAAAKAAAEQAANDRVLRAALKVEAIKAGLVDMDALKMLDTSSITLDEHGEPVGAAEFFAALKESKGYLFTAAPVHSSQPNPPPPAPGTVPAKKASEMTKEEYAAAKRARIAGR
jgi:hypothetical protein